MSSLLPPGTCITFVSHRAQYSHFSAFHARRLSSNIPPHALALSSKRFTQEKVSTKTSMQSGGFAPALLTLVGTRVTHYSTGVACYLSHLSTHLMYIHRNKPFPCLCLLLIERRALLLLWPQTTRRIHIIPNTARRFGDALPTAMNTRVKQKRCKPAHQTRCNNKKQRIRNKKRNGNKRLERKRENIGYWHTWYVVPGMM